MQFWNHYIAGVEDVWCLLAVNVFLLVFVTVRLFRAWSSHRMIRLESDESGATYMLPLVLTMPFYVLLITMIIECTLMLTAKIGSVGAAYSAARAAAVWLPYENAMPKVAPDYTPFENRQNMVRLAAARAMFPYASGSTSHASDLPLDEFTEATANQQIAVFQAYSGNQKFDAEYLKRKFAYAYNSSTVEIKYLHPETGNEYGAKEVPAFNAKIQLTLRYEAPIHTYGIGRLFGERSQFGSHYVRPVVTTVMIENEGVKFHFEGEKFGKQAFNRSLGIRYYDRRPGPNASQSGQPDSLETTPLPRQTAVLHGGYDSRSLIDNEFRASERLRDLRNANSELIDRTTDLSAVETLVLVMHGTKDQNGDGLLDAWFNTPSGELVTINARQLADLLRDMNFEGNSIELLVCDSESYAQELADALGSSHPGVQVTGYPHSTHISRGGEAVITSSLPFVRIAESGEVVAYSPAVNDAERLSLGSTFSSEARPVTKVPRLTGNP